MSKKSIRISLILCLTLLFPAVLAYCQIAYQPVGVAGGIDYSKRVIVSKGIGMPGGVGGRGGQIRAAIMDAQRNFLEVTKGAIVDSRSTIEDFVLKSDVINSQVRGVAKNFTVVDTAYFDDGSIEVTLQFSMEGELLNAVLPQDMGTGATPTAAPPAAPGKAYSGLIVDARGLNVRPALAPKVLDENGKEVYGSSYVSREYAVQQGMVGYAKDPDKAASNERVSPDALLVKGIKADGPNKTDIIISNNDASALLAISENLNFLRKCKVIVLVD